MRVKEARFGEIFIKHIEKVETSTELTKKENKQVHNGIQFFYYDFTIYFYCSIHIFLINI